MRSSQIFQQFPMIVERVAYLEKNNEANSNREELPELKARMVVIQAAAIAVESLKQRIAAFDADGLRANSYPINENLLEDKNFGPSSEAIQAVNDIFKEFNSPEKDFVAYFNKLQTKFYYFYREDINLLKEVAVAMKAFCDKVERATQMYYEKKGFSISNDDVSNRSSSHSRLLDRISATGIQEQLTVAGSMKTVKVIQRLISLTDRYYQMTHPSPASKLSNKKESSIGFQDHPPRKRARRLA